MIAASVSAETVQRRFRLSGLQRHRGRRAGKGSRCHGYLSGGTVMCSREDHAGNAEFVATSQAYRHRAKGPCPCGVEHAPAEKTARRLIASMSIVGPMERFFSRRSGSRTQRISASDVPGLAASQFGT